MIVSLTTKDIEVIKYCLDLFTDVPDDITPMLKQARKTLAKLNKVSR